MAFCSGSEIGFSHRALAHPEKGLWHSPMVCGVVVERLFVGRRHLWCGSSRVESWLTVCPRGFRQRLHLWRWSWATGDVDWDGWVNSQGSNGHPTSRCLHSSKRGWDHASRAMGTLTECRRWISPEPRFRCGGRNLQLDRTHTMMEGFSAERFTSYWLDLVSGLTYPLLKFELATEFPGDKVADWPRVYESCDLNRYIRSSLSYDGGKGWQNSFGTSKVTH